MSKRLTIEIEERTADGGGVRPPAIRVYVDGEQVGLISSLKLELDKGAAFPKLEVDVCSSLEVGEPGMVGSVQEAIGLTSHKLRGFSWATVMAPEGV